MNETPIQLQQIDTSTLGIAWSDGHESRCNVHALRVACRCAICIDEHTGERRIDPRHIPSDVRPLHIRPVGNYAIHITWSDGHNTGFYRFDHLREVCR